MKQEQINSLLNSFFISQEDLNNRENFKEFTNSLSDIIIDEFAQKYLLNNPYLSVYLAHTDGSMLLKKMKTFLAFVLTAQVDEEYVKRVHFIGSIHYSIKLEPAKVSYGFWALNEIINKMADINEVVNENRSLISKILKFVEHLMNDGYYIQKENQTQNLNAKHNDINIQSEIYSGLSKHSKNMKQVDMAFENMDISYLSSISEESSSCSVGETLNRFSIKSNREDVLGVDFKEIINIHNQWHEEFSRLKESLKQKDEDSAREIHLLLHKTTKNLQGIIDTLLKNSLENGQLELDSGMRAMQKMTELFYDKNFQDEDKISLLSSIDNSINNRVLLELQWLIQEIRVQAKNNFTQEYDIIKHIRYKAQDIFVGIKIKKVQSTGYLIEMINLLLEVFDLHLSLKERELSHRICR